MAHRLDGLNDDPRPGVPRQIGDDAVEAVIVKTLEETPKERHPLDQQRVPMASGNGHEPVGYQPDLPGVRTQASSGRVLQALARSSVRGESP